MVTPSLVAPLFVRHRRFLTRIVEDPRQSVLLLLSTLVKVPQTLRLAEVLVRTCLSVKCKGPPCIGLCFLSILLGISLRGLSQALLPLADRSSYARQLVTRRFRPQNSSNSLLVFVKSIGPQPVVVLPISSPGLSQFVLACSSRQTFMLSLFLRALLNQQYSRSLLGSVSIAEVRQKVAGKQCTTNLPRTTLTILKKAVQPHNTNTAIYT